MLELMSTDNKQTFIDADAISWIQQQEGYTIIGLTCGSTVEVQEHAADIKRERDEFFDA